ncbi:hypothetical protein C485_00400 [Natrinema altunense JCM 12890]|uniref:OB domain-containing protein n=1 Tax=Natrinema altunense (strain JCM 12890 / CGMCC 1.3731 / AJ2) TaxID=1227494 RepID=M0A282_NATA2|nr:hypothetical protein C485_00400 [Natrinema altunense JCM 12890]
MWIGSKRVPAVRRCRRRSTRADRELVERKRGSTVHRGRNPPCGDTRKRRRPSPSSSAIQQVGLIEDETGRTKFTVWEKSRKTVVREGQTVRFRAIKKNWYQGRCSLAITGCRKIEFPERGRWWEE